MDSKINLKKTPNPNSFRENREDQPQRQEYIPNQENNNNNNKIVFSLKSGYIPRGLKRSIVTIVLASIILLGILAANYFANKILWISFLVYCITSLSLIIKYAYSNSLVIKDTDLIYTSGFKTITLPLSQIQGFSIGPDKDNCLKELIGEFLYFIPKSSTQPLIKISSHLNDYDTIRKWAISNLKEMRYYNYNEHMLKEKALSVMSYSHINKLISWTKLIIIFLSILAGISFFVNILNESSPEFNFLFTISIFIFSLLIYSFSETPIRLFAIYRNANSLLIPTILPILFLFGNLANDKTVLSYDNTQFLFLTFAITLILLYIIVRKPKFSYDYQRQKTLKAFFFSVFFAYLSAYTIVTAMNETFDYSERTVTKTTITQIDYDTDSNIESITYKVNDVYHEENIVTSELPSLKDTKEGDTILIKQYKGLLNIPYFERITPVIIN
ncbi:MAG: hypothetical protein ACEPOV_06300 [Hyphomicrobiales bacterium]